MNDIMKRPLVVVLLTTAVCVLPTNARAADAGKNFAAKGLAALPCAAFAAEREKHSRTYNEAMAWLTGFISAYNYLTPDTYDVAPWQSVELLSSLLAAHCRENPKEPFFHATDKLLNSISKDRLRTSSEIVTVSVGNRKLNMYRDIVFRVQTALIANGYLKARWATGDYDQATAAAMKDFQAANKLDLTGLPDQPSLSVLFRK